MAHYSIILYRDCFGNISADPTPMKKTMSIREYLAATDPQKLAEVCAKGRRKQKTYFYRVGNSAGYAQALANAPTVAPTPIGRFECSVDGRFKEWQVRRALINAAIYNRQDAVIEPKSEESKPAHARMCYVFAFTRHDV